MFEAPPARTLSTMRSNSRPPLWPSVDVTESDERSKTTRSSSGDSAMPQSAASAVRVTAPLTGSMRQKCGAKSYAAGSYSSPYPAPGAGGSGLHTAASCPPGRHCGDDPAATFFD